MYVDHQFNAFTHSEEVVEFSESGWYHRILVGAVRPRECILSASGGAPSEISQWPCVVPYYQIRPPFHHPHF
jgi:hypothetical protein